MSEDSIELEYSGTIQHEGKTLHQFDAVALNSASPVKALQFAMDPSSVEIKHADSNMISDVVITLLDDIKKFHQEQRKFILVVDISNFPTTLCGFDERDQAALNSDSSQFSADIRKQWDIYEFGKTILIIDVNLKVSCTGLRLLDLSKLV